MKFAICRTRGHVDDRPCETAVAKVAYFRDGDGRTVPHKWWEMDATNVGALVAVLQAEGCDSSVDTYHAPDLDFINGDEVPEIMVVLKG